MRPALSTIAVTRFRPGPWKTDAFVLLRPLACDNRTKADLSRLTGCGHEVHPIPRPRLFGVAQFTFHHPRRPLPPQPVRRICRRPWLPPGACRIRARSHHPGTAFFCPNRYSNLGCGRTFSVLWDEILPHDSLRMTKGLFPDYSNPKNRYVRQRNNLLPIQ